MATAAVNPVKGAKIRPLKVCKRTSIGSGMPRNKHQRRRWKRYRGQGRP